MSAQPMTTGTRTLVGHARPVAALMATASALAAVASLVELVPFYLMYRAVDSVMAGDATGRELVNFGLWTGAAAAAQVVIWAAAMYVSHVAAYEHLHGLRVRLLDRFTHLPLGRVTERHSGELQRVVIDDVGRIELFVSHSLPELVASVVAWTVITTWLLLVDPWMTLAVVAVVSVAFAVLMVGTRESRHYLGATSGAGRRLAQSLVDLVDGLVTLALFDRSDRPPAPLDRAIDDVADSNAEWLGRFAPYGTTYTVLIASPALLLVPVGGSLVVAGRADPSDLLLFLVVGLGYGAPIVRLRRIWFQLNMITYSAGLIDDVLRLEAQPEAMGPAPSHGADISFEAVKFGYGDALVLDGVDLHVPSGTQTALVGPSGSGKTTIARLVARFWDADSGRVVIGGVDVRDLPPSELSSTIACVFQDTFLFRDTVAANLRVGRPDATDAQVHAAARAARAHEFVVDLPDGYDTVVGTRGARLSGGQRQRLAIARALLHDAPILVLDEATAFVDPDDEDILRQGLAALSTDRTVLVVAHRLSSIVDADQILFVDGGRIVERGTHDELLRAGGAYRRLWDDWTLVDGVADRGAARS